SAPMVRAILDGTKTQTRRVIKPQPDYQIEVEDDGSCVTYNGDKLVQRWQSPYGKVGDQLWVRETFRCNGWATDLATIFYKANDRNSYTEISEQFPVDGKKKLPVDGRWRPSIHMPRWASRIQLEITDIRVERIKSLTIDDMCAEGIGEMLEDPESIAGHGFAEAEHYSIAGVPMMHLPEIYGFAAFWDSINGQGSWDLNPWVWVVEFKRVK
ncbi:MAG: hypothetical protein KAS19_04280, partial [Anaerolineales bacterium]|nr:hypothetical protein [Anaerolineales bacterium]